MWDMTWHNLEGVERVVFTMVHVPSRNAWEGAVEGTHNVCWAMAATAAARCAVFTFTAVAVFCWKQS